MAVIYRYAERDSRTQADLSATGIEQFPKVQKRGIASGQACELRTVFLNCLIQSTRSRLRAHCRFMSTSEPRLEIAIGSCSRNTTEAASVSGWSFGPNSCPSR